MNLGKVACAMGRHKIDEAAVAKVHGQNFARCKRCSTAMELVGFDWMPIALRDASLGRRRLG